MFSLRSGKVVFRFVRQLLSSPCCWIEQGCSWATFHFAKPGTPGTPWYLQRASGNNSRPVSLCDTNVLWLLLWKNIFSFLKRKPQFKFVCVAFGLFALGYWLVGASFYSEHSFLSFVNISFHSVCCLPIFLSRVFWWTEVFNFVEDQLITFKKQVLCFFCILRSLCVAQGGKDIFLFRCWIPLYFRFRCKVHLKSFLLNIYFKLCTFIYAGLSSLVKFLNVWW